MDKENVVYIYIYIHTHTHNGISFVNKKKEILPFVTTWKNLEDIMPSEKSQTENANTNTWSHLYVESKKVNLIEPENRIVITRG